MLNDSLHTIVNPIVTIAPNATTITGHTGSDGANLLLYTHRLGSFVLEQNDGLLGFSTGNDLAHGYTCFRGTIVVTEWTSTSISGTILATATRYSDNAEIPISGKFQADITQ